MSNIVRGDREKCASNWLTLQPYRDDNLDGLTRNNLYRSKFV